MMCCLFSFNLFSLLLLVSPQTDPGWWCLQVWFNNKGWIAIVAYMNSLNNIILRSYMPATNRSHYGIVTINHPMNFTQQQLDEESL